MKIVYSPKYEVNLGTHPFVTRKFRLVKELVEKNFKNIEFVEPEECSYEELLLVHTKEYVDKVINLTLSYEEILKLEIPIDREICSGARTCVRGTIIASELALKHGVGLHIGGGFHHAFPDHGEGFCIFNDIAIAARYIQKNYRVKKIAVIDCDLHQGNGTAYIFRKDNTVFTFSIHEGDIYPVPKEKSSLDINLSAGTMDNEYLSLLEEGLKEVLLWGPEFVIYQSGVDPYEYDSLGNLKLTKSGILNRDIMVRDYFKNLPTVVTLGGGYAIDVKDTVELHYNTITTFLQKR